MLGDFLEISLTSSDLLASLEFYRKLDFHEAPVGEGWKHPYAVMSDGRIHIGLHKRADQGPTLSFVLPELRKKLEGIEALGIDFTAINLELHRFNHVAFEDPEGNPVALLEARTYSPMHGSEPKPSLCGYFMEYRLPVADVAAAARFWESLGLIVETAEDGRYAQASWGGINLGLEQMRPRARPALVFENADLEETGALLEMRGIGARADPQGIRVATPEGIELLLKPEGT